MTRYDFEIDETYEGDIYIASVASPTGKWCLAEDAEADKAAAVREAFRAGHAAGAQEVTASLALLEVADECEAHNFAEWQERKR